jgi:hypothetical protein
MRTKIQTKLITAAFFMAMFLNTEKLQAQNTAPQWPSLAQQLIKAKANPGSAYEALIIANQDFSILREDEKSDKITAPPWLRVYWRKAHPDGNYNADDASGGYPRVLNEMLEWMKSHQNLLSGPGYQGSGITSPNSTITNEQKISGSSTAIKSESDIRINFFDPTKIIGASNNISGTGRQSIFYSTNSGTSWSQTELPLNGTDSYHSDPTVDWTSDGRAWSSTLGIVGGLVRVKNYYSTDNGATWTFDATPSGTQTNVDKQMVWIDHSSTSPYFNQQYAIWQVTTAYFNRRTAGAGGTWLAAPVAVSGAESTGSTIGSDIKTNSAGDVFAFWPTTGNRKIIVRKSTNGGVSFSAAVQAATTYSSYDIGVPSFNNRRALIYTSGGAYRTASKNMVYVAWTDLSGEVGCTAAANEPGSNVASTCKTRIWFVRSTDGGTTWSTATMINNKATLNDQFNQWLAVDEVTGTISIMYYDTKDDAGRKKTNVYHQFSSDDGVTWSTAEKVTSAQTDETVATADLGNQYGDYNGMSAYNNVAFPVWTDRRNNASEEIWTAKLSSIVIPVKLIYFNASLQNGNNALVNWRIATAEDGTVYQLQRSSDGRNFTNANSITGNANTIQFSYTDAALQNGTYYYRLKIVSRGGSVNYSNTAVLKVGSKEIKVFVYPNPLQKAIDDKIQVSITNASLQAYTLTDAQGRTLLQKENINSNGSLSIGLPVKITSGTYLLRLQTDKGVFMERVIVY